MRNRWTAQENNLIREVYPTTGMKDTFRILCDRLGDRHSWESFRTQIYALGLNVTPERWRKACENNGKRENVPVGTIVKRGRGERWIKVGKGTAGWMPYKNYLLGKPAKGHSIVHLDGNPENDSIDNLAVISREISAKMMVNGFWSQNAIITKTGILCCELESMVGKKGKV